ncbi:MAG: hypothetical protein ACR2P7_06535 [bacterium]
MALVKCIECKKKVSSDAEACPHCGIGNPAVERKNCSHCAKKILSNADKCNHCGADHPFAVLIKCKNCKKRFDVMASACPHCGAKKPSIGGIMGIVLGVSVVVVMVMIFTNSSNQDTAKEQAKTHVQPKAKVEPKKVAACSKVFMENLFKYYVQKSGTLRDPDSFEKIRTISGIEQNGRRSVQMTFRAKNGFGGYSISTAYGSYATTAKDGDCGWDELRLQSIK